MGKKGEVPPEFKKQWKDKDKDNDGKENEPKPDFLKKKEKKGGEVPEAFKKQGNKGDKKDDSKDSKGKKDDGKMPEALKEKFPNIHGPRHEDICYATQNRQDVVKSIAPDVDLMLVVGSANSSNSNQLRAMAEQQGTKAYLIDDAQHIDPAWLENVNHIGVTAGASAPEVLVTAVVEYLQQHGTLSVTEVDGVEENIEFALPKELRIKTVS